MACTSALGVVGSSTCTAISGACAAWDAGGKSRIAGCRQVTEVTLEPTELSSAAGLSLRGKSGELLPQIVEGPW